MYSSVIRKRFTPPILHPLPTLLLVLLGDSSINKYNSYRISRCIRVCISVDTLYNNNILYTPHYYSGVNKLKKKVLEDMEYRNIISLDKTLFTYKYRVKDIELSNKLHKEIEEYLTESSFLIRYDTLILCLLYLGRYDILDFSSKKIQRIKEYHKDKEECLQHIL
ncbi:hypothetical protein P3W45_001002 [Vairimorpha bombi]|jgi:hypothetical protein